MLAFLILLAMWAMFALGRAWQSPASYQRGKVDGSIIKAKRLFDIRHEVWLKVAKHYKEHYDKLHAAYVLKNKPCAYNAPCKQKARARDPVTGRILKRGAV